VAESLADDLWMDRGLEESRCEGVSQIVEPQSREPDPAHEPVPVAGERVGGERSTVAPLDHEVEVLPGLPEENPALELALAVTAQERDGRWRESNRAAPAIRLRREEHEVRALLRQRYPLRFPLMVCRSAFSS
jgi:hypothetical protein